MSKMPCRGSRNSDWVYLVFCQVRRSAFCIQLHSWSDAFPPRGVYNDMRATVKLPLLRSWWLSVCTRDILANILGHCVCLVMLILGSLAPAQQQTTQLTGSVEGIVFDENDQPLPSAQVTPDDGSAKGSAIPWSTTDTQGRFRIRNLHSGDWVLLARKLEDGYMDQTLSFGILGDQKPPRVRVEGGTLTSGIVLRLGPKAASVHIDLVDVNTGLPIKDLIVHMEQVGFPDRYVRGRQGAPADMLFPSTAVKLSVTSVGYDTWTASEYGHDYITFKSGEHRTLTVQLKRVVSRSTRSTHS